MPSLSERAMLVHPLIRSPGFNRRDAVAARQAAAHHNVSDPSRIALFKNLVPKCSGFDKITANETQMRRTVKEETLPWRWDGVFLVPNKNYMRLLDRWNELVDERHSLVNAFQDSYAINYHQWAEELGALGHDFDYPDPESLPRRFKATLELFPLPDVEDFRTEVSLAKEDEIRDQMLQEQQNTLTEMREHLTETLTSLAQRLLDALANHRPGDPASTLRQPLIEAVQAGAMRLVRLNVLDDPELEGFATALYQATEHATASDLREDDSLRITAKYDVQAVLDSILAPQE